MKAVYSPLLLGIFGLFAACSTAPEFDTVLTNARIAEFHGDSLSYRSVHLALRDGRIAAVVPAAKAVPAARDTTDLTGSYVYPGFIDAHAHFLALGQALETVDLVGTRSWAECVDRVRQYVANHPEVAGVRGRGWDQNDWADKAWPTSNALDGLTDKPIVLSRLDGHAV
ncbi:MAG: amidohydrolase family protein, partial [Schleiferiaceae bacterium]|nr:amidohydrolase family protein [Schleiferiaceae bacterium]